MHPRTALAVGILCACLPVTLAAQTTSPQYGPPGCSVTGDRLARAFVDRICKLVVEVRRDDSLLRLRFSDSDLAVTMRARTVQAENWLLSVQAEFKRTTGQKVVTTEVFYGRVKLASVQTNWLGEDKVTWGGA